MDLSVVTFWVHSLMSMPTKAIWTWDLTGKPVAQKIIRWHPCALPVQHDMNVTTTWAQSIS